MLISTSVGPRPARPEAGRFRAGLPIDRRLAPVLGLLTLGLAGMAPIAPLLVLLVIAGAMSIALALLRPAWVLLGMLPVITFDSSLATTSHLAGLLGLVTLGVARVHRGRFRLHGWLPILVLTVLLVASYVRSHTLDIESGSRFALLAYLLAGFWVAGLAATLDIKPDHVLRLTALNSVLVSAVVVAGGATIGQREGALGLNPNFLGLLLALGIVATVALASNHYRPLWLIAAAPMSYALLVTQSRGAALALAVGLGVLLLQRNPRARAAGIAVLIACACFAGPGLVHSTNHTLLANRTSTELSSNTEIRTEAANLAWRYIAAAPLTGVGYGLFPPNAAQDQRLGIYINTHNDFLRLGAEAGLPTLLVFLVVIGRGLRPRRISAMALPDAAGRAVIVCYLAGLLFTNSLATLSVTLPFWLLLGIASTGRREASIIVDADPAPVLDLTKPVRLPVPSPRSAALPVSR